MEDVCAVMAAILTQPHVFCSSVNGLRRVLITLFATLLWAEVHISDGGSQNIYRTLSTPLLAIAQFKTLHCSYIERMYAVSRSLTAPTIIGTMHIWFPFHVFIIVFYSIGEADL